MERIKQVKMVNDMYRYEARAMDGQSHDGKCSSHWRCQDTSGTGCKKYSELTVCYGTYSELCIFFLCINI